MSKRCFDGLQILHKGYRDNENHMKRGQTKKYLIREEICSGIREGNIGYMISKNWKSVCYIQPQSHKVTVKKHIVKKNMVRRHIATKHMVMELEMKRVLQYYMFKVKIKESNVLTCWNVFALYEYNFQLLLISFWKSSLYPCTKFFSLISLHSSLVHNAIWLNNVKLMHQKDSINSSWSMITCPFHTDHLLLQPSSIAICCFTMCLLIICFCTICLFCLTLVWLSLTFFPLLSIVLDNHETATT